MTEEQIMAEYRGMGEEPFAATMRGVGKAVRQ